MKQDRLAPNHQSSTTTSLLLQWRVEEATTRDHDEDDRKKKKTTTTKEQNNFTLSVVSYHCIFVLVVRQLADIITMMVSRTHIINSMVNDGAGVLVILSYSLSYFNPIMLFNESWAERPAELVEWMVDGGGVGWGAFIQIQTEATGWHGGDVLVRNSMKYRS